LSGAILEQVFASSLENWDDDLEDVDIYFFWREVLENIFDCLVNLLEDVETLFTLDGEIEPEEEWVQEQVEIHAIVLLDFDQGVGLILALSSSN
jgi:hypothetical protein